MSTVTNPFQACNDIFFKPNQVFSTIAEKHNWSWIPFILVTVMALLPSYYYFNFIDFEWYKELIISSNYADISPSEQKRVRDNMSLGQIQNMTLAFGFFGLVIVNAIIAVYLNVVTKSDEENLNGFTDWYGFTWWAAMPSIIAGLVALLVLLLASDHQLSPVALMPTSLAYWLNISMDSTWYNWAQGIRIESIWSIYLTAIGIQQWTRIAKNKAIIIAVAPTLMILGIWSLILLVN